MKIELHTIATYNDKEYELEELMNIILKDNNELHSIIKEARELLNQEWYSVLRKETITKVKEILDKVEENK